MRFFEENGVGLSEGADFGTPGWVRLNFGCPRATLEIALQRVLSACSKLSIGHAGAISAYWRTSRFINSMQSGSGSPHLTDRMAIFRRPPAWQSLRKATPYAVGLLGPLLLTAWLANGISISDQDRLEQRFQREAHEKAEAVIRPFEEQLAIFQVLQRVFHTVGQLDEETFSRILDPMSRSAGLRGFGWAPMVSGDGRSEFERQGKQRWGASFSIVETGAGGAMTPARERDRYFPVLFQVPVEGRNGHTALT